MRYPDINRKNIYWVSLDDAGGIAFVAGAGAAIGSSVVKVPLAVCIRSVQAGAYPNAIAAARSIVDTAGVRSLFTVSLFAPSQAMPKDSITTLGYNFESSSP